MDSHKTLHKNSNHPQWFSHSLLLLVLLINFVALKYNSFKCFMPFDMGIYIDAAWRVYSGQKPYVDFLYNAGPIHIYLYAFFYFLFGFSQTAILAFTVTTSSIVTVIVYLMLYKRLPVFITFIVTLLTPMAFNWCVSHPWWDHTAHVFGILGLAIFISQLDSESKKSAMIIGISCALCAAFSFATKQNIGTFYGLFFIGGLLGLKEKSTAFKGFLLGSLIGFVVSLILIRAPVEFFDQFFKQYETVGQHRFSRFRNLSHLRVNHYWAPLAIVTANFILSGFKRKLYFYLLAGITAIGVVSFITSGIYFLSNHPLWGVQMSLAFLIIFALIESQQNPWIKKIHQLSMIILVLGTFMFCLLSIKHTKQMKIWIPRDNPFGDYALKSEPLTGWMVKREHGEPLDAMVSYIKTHTSEEESLLNISDMYTIYALTNRDSYRKVPFAFSVNDIPTPGEQIQSVRANILQNPPDWLILSQYSQEALLPYLGLVDEVSENYEIRFTSGDYTLLRRN